MQSSKIRLLLLCMSRDLVGRKHKLSTILLKKRKKETIAGAYAQNHHDGSQSVTTTAPASMMVHDISTPEGGTLRISGWGCAAGTLEPLTYTRASSAEFCYPILE